MDLEVIHVTKLLSRLKCIEETKTVELYLICSTSSFFDVHHHNDTIQII